MTCSETYYPMWSARGIRGVKCQRSAKWRKGDRLFCGVHARSYLKWNPGASLDAVP